MDEKDKNKGTDNSGDGDKSEAVSEVDKLNAASERLEKATKERTTQLDREEAILNEKALGGTSEAGAQPPVKEKLTDKEYAEAMERGEVNPLADDGYL